MHPIHRYFDNKHFSTLRHLFDNIKTETFIKKGDEVIEYLGSKKYIVLVVSGFIKIVLTSDDGEELVTDFIGPNDILCNISDSQMKVIPYIQANASSHLRIKLINISTIEGNSNALKSYNDFCTLVKIFSYEQSVLNQSKTTEKKYADLLTWYDDIEKIVPPKDIASYLRISSGHLCKIKK